MTLRDDKYLEGNFESRGWYGKERTDQTVWEASVERSIRCLETFDDVVVSFSGGKDSTAALHAAMKAHEVLGLKEPLKVAYCDEEVVTPETDEYVERIRDNYDIDLRWYVLPFQQRNACSLSDPFWYPWCEEDRHLWVKDDFPDGATNFEWNTPLFPKVRKDRPSIAKYSQWFIADWNENAPKRRSLCVIMGIRVDENMMRRAVIAMRGKNRHAEPWLVQMSGKDSWYHKAYTVYDWSVDDVWAIVARHDIDYNTTYDLYEALGVPQSKQRIGPPFGEEPLHGLWVWQQCHPEMWEKMLNRVPGVGTAARYSNTVLYGRSGNGQAASEDDLLPELAPGEKYIDVVKKAISGHSDPAVRSDVAKLIRRMIRSHQGRTTDPILPNEPHPYTGISWRLLHELAVRADLKRRKSMGMNVNDHQREAATAAYEHRLLTMTKDGTIDACR